MMKHPWHEVSIGREAPEEVNAIIEAPKGCKLKYELDKKSGLLKLDRALYSAVHYPGDYGFFPQTYWEDNDPLDVIVLSNEPVYPMTLVSVRPIGVLEMDDNGESDDKIIAVYSKDPRYKEYHDLSDIPEHTKTELMHYFETYKELQGKKVKVNGFLDAKTARKIILKAMKLYKENRKRLIKELKD